MRRKPRWFLRLGDLVWSHQRPIRAIACFFLGHDVKCGELQLYNTMDPDWCARCWYNSSECNLEEGWTMPRMLNHAYCWMVERHWRWFDNLDYWLCSRAEWLPRWWNY